MFRLRLATLVPVVLLSAALLIYVGVAVWLGQTQYLTFDNLLTILGRSIALGITAVGQTFAILVASIDLSVANLISVAAVLASFVMDGDPSMMLPATALVLAVVPLILATGPGAGARFSMGLIIATGMTIGTLFTLFVLPAVYLVLARDHHAAEEPASA